MTITCVCCGHTATFEMPDDAYRAGWDAPPHFSISLCDLCPAAPVAMFGLDAARTRHARMHALWARDGRPDEFDLNAELALDGVTGAAAVKAKHEIEALKAAAERDPLALVDALLGTKTPKH